MRPWLSTASLAACLLLIPAAARADDVSAALTPVGVPVTVALPTPAARPRSPVRPVLYGVQLLDATLTAAALRRTRRYEANPLMGPFAHGGIPTLALGFALGDIVRARIFHRDARAAQAADVLQAAANVDGIRTTLRSLHAP